jgi:hypothetical protein
MHRCLHRMMGARRVRPTLALLVLFATAEAVRGQELEMFVLSGSSANPELARYSGIGVATGITLRSGLRLRVALDTESSSLVREGQVCAKPGFSCALEAGIVDETRHSGLSVTLHGDLALSDRVRLSAAAGPRVSKIAMDATSVSQRAGEYGTVCLRRICTPVERVPRFLAPKTIQLGVTLIAEIQIRPVPPMPWVVSVGWDRKMVLMEECAVGETYAPFCGWDQFRELRVGVGYVF